MSIYGLHTSNSHRQIDNPKCTILAEETIILDEKSHNYFKESLFEYVIYEIVPQVFLNK